MSEGVRKATAKIIPRGNKKKRSHQNKGGNNQIEAKGTIHKINVSNSWFFEKINGIDTILAQLIKKKRREDTIQQHSR